MREDPTTPASAWGIDPGYSDVNGQWNRASATTVSKVLTALGADPVLLDDGMVAARSAPPAVGEQVWVVRSGEAVDAGGRFHLRTEDGQELTHVGGLPPDLPLGYHDLELVEEERSVRLIVSPGRGPDPHKAWGWSAQLYAARSERSWGIGDLGDLAALARWSREIGAGALLVNPLHGAAPSGGQQASPYYPASRVFRNPIYLNVPAVDGADGVEGLAEAAAAGRSLNDSALIDRDAVWDLKVKVLHEAFTRWEERHSRIEGDAFSDYSVEQGDELEAWGAWCVACEMAGPDRSTWPTSLTVASLVAAVRADPELGRRARFHAWLQWQLDRQLAAAGREGPVLITDLAIGCDPGGFDSWLWPDAFVSDLRVGAPPDVFAPEGQDWGLPPFDPWALRRLAFAPFTRVVRAGLRHSGGLRMDHVMGLFRLFVVPTGDLPVDGCYIRYPATELLDILTLEAHRAGAFVIGEDLGTVQPEVRSALASRQVLGTKLLWFEDAKPETWPEGALGAVTTHDLPTVAGAWTGDDVADQHEAGAPAAEEAVDDLALKLASWTGLDRAAPAEEAVVAAHRILAEAPCALVLATLEDAAGQRRRPNLPGTVDAQRPNWRIPLPVMLEDLPEQSATKAIVDAMQHRSAGSP